jgi:hypothetical protein
MWFTEMIVQKLKGNDCIQRQMVYDTGSCVGKKKKKKIRRRTMDDA